MLILRTLEREPTHGWGIAQHIKQVSEEVLRVEEGSLYPALHRLEVAGEVSAEWGLSENNRRARIYRLTARGRRRLRRRARSLGLAGGRHRARAGDGVTGGRLAGVLRRLARLFRRSDVDRELDEELRFHLEMGRPPPERRGRATRTPGGAARLRLGNPLRLREESRDVLGFPRLEALARDASLAARRLDGHPASRSRPR